MATFPDFPAVLNIGKKVDDSGYINIIGEYPKDEKNKNLLHVKEELSFEDFRKFLRKSQPFGRSFFENIIHHQTGANDLE